MNRVLSFLRLPEHVSAFERDYLKRMNRVGMLFFALHLPVFVAIAWFNDTNPLLALALTSAVLACPAIAYFAFEHPRSVSMVFGFTAMLMGALLAHFGQGPAQIEMHFYFFALLAMLAVYANPMVIVTAAVTVAVQHLATWWWLPSSVFNYEAPWWVIGIHATFVVVESVATCFIARSFFDNVIGLEKIVQARTTALDARNQDMRLVLDNVHEGFLTIDRSLVISPERSAIVETWLGPLEANVTLPELLLRHAPRVAAALRLGWDEVLADIMPLELTLMQLPSRFDIGDRHYSLAYKPIMAGERLEKALVVISDITAEIARERLELEQRDVMQILSRVAEDKNGVLEFFQEATEQVRVISEQKPSDLRVQKRVIHTLKGNSMIFGVRAIAQLCEQLEDQIDEQGVLPSLAERAELQARWTKLCGSLDMLLGERRRNGIELDDGDYEQILSAVLRGDPREHIASMIQNWRLEPTIKRLVRIGEQARALAVRTGKGAVAVDIQDNQLRLDSTAWAPFWSTFVHVVRNAVDHGLESEHERAEKGKGRATITLATRIERDRLVIELSDDGRGINWTRVAAKARDRGLPHETQADLVEALFADGLSTVEHVTEYSGRGVGMAAVRASATALSGTMHIGDRPGGGTRVTFSFPSPIAALPLRQSA
jgi:two-component system chemotaxis sensor kinase CheA